MAEHAVVVPYPGQGHINPMMQLAKKIASKGISVTFVLTESWHRIITEAHGDSDAFTHARTLGLDIRPGYIPDCLPDESNRAANMKLFFDSLIHMEPHVSKLITNLTRSETVPTCIVADVFLKWAVPLAKLHGLRSVSLWPITVMGFSLFYHSDLVRTEGSVDYIPGVPPLEPTELPAALTSPVGSEIAECFVSVRKADWIVANSFYALDGRAVEALWPKIRVHCVGPLLPSAYLDRSDLRDRKVGTSLRAETDCTQWLDSKPPRSVIYISFGSFLPLTRPQIWEMALGLMESGYYFVWALRPDKEASHVSEMLPPGFLDECKERGLVEPWFKQVELLSHPSMGGFLSHCGWNAVMESVSSGVPIVGFPLGMDQFTNCKLVVDEWKFGLRLRSREDGERVIGRDEIARKVKMLMEGESFRRAAERFRDLGREEVSKGGRSENNVEALVNALRGAKSL